MKGKGRTRLIEWGKNLLIVLLAASALYLLGQTRFSVDIREEVIGFLDRSTSDSTEQLHTQTSAAKIRPFRITINLDQGQRYGVQYDPERVDEAYSSVSTLLFEALSSAGEPRRSTEERWRSQLAGSGIYVDFYYPVSLALLSGQMGEGQSNGALSGTVRRLCLSANSDGSLSLFYINEADGLVYSSKTTLSQAVHLDPVLERWSPNGALFAFEVPGMETVAPYVLLTSTPRPLIYRAGNPLLTDDSRVAQLLDALSFRSRGTQLDPAVGGALVEGNDSLRLLETGVLTFHTIGDDEYRFMLPDNTLQSALSYTQELADTTVGIWCGAASLCLAGVEEGPDGVEILFQYCLDGVPVELPEGNVAARFTIRNGAVTDFSLCLRTYSATEDVTLVLPELQAAAVLGDTSGQENELTLLYQDQGGEILGAAWIAG